MPVPIYAAGLCFTIYTTNVLIRLSARGSAEPLVGNVGKFLLVILAAALFVTGTLQQSGGETCGRPIINNREQPLAG